MTLLFIAAILVLFQGVFSLKPITTYNIYSYKYLNQYFPSAMSHFNTNHKINGTKSYLPNNIIT